MSPGVLLYNNVLESLMFQRYDSGVQLPAPAASPPLRHVPEQCTVTPCLAGPQPQARYQ